jgi:hypothetical protein
MAKETQADIKVSNPLVDYAKLNPAGVGQDRIISNARDEIIGGTEDYIKSLEDRYAQPNWFKVAAGFAKPQLGGFMASLGSALEPLGENLEQQRAIQPTIAQLRLQNAVGREGLAQRTEAQRMLDQAVAKPNGLTSEDVANIRKFHPETGEIAQQKFTNQQSIFSNRMDELRASNSKLEAYQKLPKDFVDMYYDTVHIIPNESKNTKPQPTSEQTSTFKNTPPLGFQGNQEDWNQMSVEEQQKARAAIQASHAETDRANLEKFGSNTKAAQSAMGVQESLYELSGKPGMEKILGLFSGAGPLASLGRLAESGTFPKAVETARAQLIANRATPEELNDFVTLASLVQSNINLIRRTQQNPTNYLTEIDEASGPSTKDPVDAFRRKVALMLHDSQYHVDQYKVYQKARKNGVSADDFLLSPENEEFQKQHTKNHVQIATNKAPTSLSELRKQFEPIQKQQLNPTATSTGSSSFVDQLKALRAEAEKAKKTNP